MNAKPEVSIAWVTAAKYAEVTGDTTTAIHSRRQAGAWRDGCECKQIEGEIWVNVQAAQNWVANWIEQPASPPVSASASSDQLDPLMVSRLIEALLAAAIAPTLPVTVDLWDVGHIAAYLKRAAFTVREQVVCQPTFPRPIRLPGKGRAQALYKAREVIAWAEGYQLPPPRMRHKE